MKTEDQKPNPPTKRTRKPKPQRFATLAEMTALADAIKDCATRLDRIGVKYTGIEATLHAPLHAPVRGFMVGLTEEQRSWLPRKPHLQIRGLDGDSEAKVGDEFDANMSFKADSAPYEVS